MVASSLPTAALGSNLMGIRTLFMLCFSIVTHTLLCSSPLRGLWSTCVMAKGYFNCHCFSTSLPGAGLTRPRSGPALTEMGFWIRVPWAGAGRGGPVGDQTMFENRKKNVGHLRLSSRVTTSWSWLGQQGGGGKGCQEGRASGKLCGVLSFRSILQALTRMPSALAEGWWWQALSPHSWSWRCCRPPRAKWVLPGAQHLSLCWGGFFLFLVCQEVCVALLSKA